MKKSNTNLYNIILKTQTSQNLTKEENNEVCTEQVIDKCFPITLPS